MWTEHDLSVLTFDPRVRGPRTPEEEVSLWDWLTTPSPPAGPPTVKLTAAELRAVRREGSALAWEASR